RCSTTTSWRQSSRKRAASSRSRATATPSKCCPPMTDWNSRFKALAGTSGARAALLVVVLWLLAMATDLGPQRWLREQLFDAYQRTLPRERNSQPAMVVEIDERSLATVGQWPWPRNKLGELIEKIGAMQPAAIGIDALFPEPDRLSPRRILQSVQGLDPVLALRSASLPDNDELFANALRGRHVALGVAGEDGAAADSRPLKSAPVLLQGDTAGILMIPQFTG